MDVVISPHALSVQSQTVEWIWGRSTRKKQGGYPCRAVCDSCPLHVPSSLAQELPPPGTCYQGFWMYLHHTPCPALSPAPTHISKDGTYLTHWAFPPSPKTVPPQELVTPGCYPRHPHLRLPSTPSAGLSRPVVKLSVWRPTSHTLDMFSARFSRGLPHL